MSNHANFFATKLSAAILSTDTSFGIDIAPLDDSNAPITSGYLVIQANSPNYREIISFAGVTGTTLTGVVRGLGGTTAIPHQQGSIVEMNLVAAEIDAAFGVPNDIIDRFDRTFPDFVVSGGVVAISSGLVGTVSDLVAYIDGVKVTKTSIPNKTFTASKDTYVRVKNDGTITYDEQTIDTVAPANPSHEVYFAKITTGVSTIDRIVQLNDNYHGTRSNRVGSVDAGTKITPNAPVFTAGAIGAAFELAVPSITATDGRVCIIRLKDDGTARAMTLNSGYSNVSGVASPTTTVLGKWMTIGTMYNAVTSKWEIQGINKEA